MGWPLIGVLNAGIEILLIIGTGWLFSKFKLLEGDRFMPQANPLMVLLCFPAFNLYRVGITLDLQSADAWRSLSAYMMWIAVIQMGIVIYTWLFNKGNLLEAALLNLIFNANNTVIMGLPIMYATTGAVGARVSLLTSVALFLQVTPFSIIAFELDRWLMSKVHEHIERKDTEKALGGSVHPALPAPKLETLAEGMEEEEEGPGGKSFNSSQPKGSPVGSGKAHGRKQEDEGLSNSSSPSPSEDALHKAEGRPPLMHRQLTGCSNDEPTLPAVQSTGDLQLLAQVQATQPKVTQSASARQPSPGASLTRVTAHALGSVAEGAAAQQQGGTYDSHHLRRVDDSCASVVGRGQESLNGSRWTGANSRGTAGAEMGSRRSGMAGSSMTSLSPFMQEAQHAYAPATSGLDGDRDRHRDPWVGMELLPTETGLEAATSSPLRAAALRAATMSAIPDHPLSGAGRRSERVKQIELTHGGHATSINVAELSRRKWATAYREWHNTTLELRARRLRQRCVQTSLAAVDIPVPLEWVQMEVVPHLRMSQYPVEQVENAKREMIDDCGGHIPFYKRFLTEHAQFVTVALIVFKNPMLWSLVLAVLISVSGLRKFLDPTSASYVDGLGWIVITLQQIAGITVPLALFSNGVWMYGKNLNCNPVKVGVILVLKVLVLPLLQMGCAMAAQLDMPSALSIVLLSATPTASTAFVIAAQYAYGCELVTLVTILHTVLLVPCALLWLYLPQIMRAWEYDLTSLPMKTSAS